MIDNIDSNESIQEKPAKKPQHDRVTLDKSEAEKLNRWLLVILEGSKGFLQLSRSDVVNFLIRQHGEEFSKKELQQIRQHHYDPIKHLLWITPKLKEAMATGDKELVASLQEEIRGVELGVIEDATSRVSELNIAEPKKERKKQKNHSIKDESRSDQMSGISSVEIDI